jgi:hypothetical protein
MVMAAPYRGRADVGPVAVCMVGVASVQPAALAELLKRPRVRSLLG